MKTEIVHFRKDIYDRDKVLDKALLGVFTFPRREEKVEMVVERIINEEDANSDVFVRIDSVGVPGGGFAKVFICVCIVVCWNCLYFHNLYL